jgi:hypothetical protein
MRIHCQPPPNAARICSALLALALACATGSSLAQAVYRHVDADGSKTYTDRREAPISRRELAPLAGQTGADSEIHGRSANFTAARSLSINQREAQRRLAQARREQARGPDMQQGIPPIAERHPGDRRRERVESLQHMVEAAQARVRELDVQSSLAQVSTHADARPAEVVAQR